MQDTITMTQNHMSDHPISEKQLEKWQDWQWQLQQSIKSIEWVEKVLDHKFEPEKRARLQRTIDQFPLAITPYYLSLVDAKDFENDPVFKQAFPDIRELDVSSVDMADPLHEEADSPVPGLTHRYPDRVLLHVSNTCAMYCRHCTRKRKVGDIDQATSEDILQQALDYIKANPQIRDVLISGGDPFMLSDARIEWILDQVSAIDHVEVMRIGTRTPVVLPYRITEDLVKILAKYKNLWINTHFNHPKEITEASVKALDMLSGVGIPLGNQSVLLADVNDCPRIMRRLVHKLVAHRVRPYYLYQCDLSEGLEHFRTSVGKGIEIMESLRGHTSGFAVPTYVIDAPGGGGKIPVMPNYLISWSTNKAILRNFEGVITTYQEPSHYTHTTCDLNCEECNLHLKMDLSDNYKTVGIEKLLSDFEETYTLSPTDLERMDNRDEREEREEREERAEQKVGNEDE